MFSKLFDHRDKKITHLTKLGDCIGRSIRENVIIFSIESENDTVTYLTESGKVITGEYSLEGDIRLDRIVIQESDVYKDVDKFDSLVTDKVSALVSNICSTNYTSADNTLSDIFGLWENRLQIDSLQDKLQDKKNQLAEKESIIYTEEFQNLAEVTPQLVDFLKENFEKISLVPEIRNAVNLSNTVSQAFDFPRLSFDNLSEGGSYTLKNGTSDSIYDMICRQELIKRELLESKKDFDSIWASNSTVKSLAGMVYEKDDVVLAEALVESLKEVPYLAMASKKSLTQVFTKCLGYDNEVISESDIQKLSSKIFELKKDVRIALTENINSRYGINIANLQESVTFKSLANTQVVIFEAVSRLSPKGSVLKRIVSEISEMLKGKSGVECIDVNDYINAVFREAGYAATLDESHDSNNLASLSLRRVTEDTLDESALADSINEKASKDAAKKDSLYPSDETMSDEEIEKAEKEEIEKAKGKKSKAKKEEEEEEEEEEKEEKEEKEAEEDVVEEEADDSSIQTEDEAIDDLSDLEDILKSITSNYDEEDTDEEEAK
jgi:hypothetical protein